MKGPRPGDPDDAPLRPLPRRIGALSGRARVAIALVGLVIGLALMLGGLKLIDNDVNSPSTPSPRVSGP